MHNINLSMVAPARPGWVLLTSVLILLWLTPAARVCEAASEILPETSAGARVYQDKCASCHGAGGEGVADAFDTALVGDKSILELADLIGKTMPEDDPESCTGDDAREVATYIYHAFYSPTAQARNAPPRIELARLTVGQYQNVIADLIASFRGPVDWNGEQGLDGEYFKSRRMRDRVLERRDAVVNFDFGESTPDPEKIKAEEFSMSWRGSLLAPETAEYEIIVETENAARLWLNSADGNAIIDAWVKSGDQTEYRATVPLVGGRAYPVRLEFFTFKEPTASIALKWKRPHRPVEVIPNRFLVPQRFPETLVVTTSFPPDDRSYGYERATSISKAWFEATSYAAVEVANYVAQHLDRLAGTRENAADRRSRISRFVESFAERAWRRPLTDDEKKRYLHRYLTEDGPPEPAVKQIVMVLLNSPPFLYREVNRDPNDPFVTATRLSFGMWDSIPDQQLWQAAANGKLRQQDEVHRQATRMAQDLRAKAKVQQFFERWLKLDHLQDLSKSSESFPGFDEQIISDLRTSLELFLDNSVWGEDSDFRQLLLSDSLYLNGRLGVFYGAGLQDNAGFQPVALQPEHRAGVLTHPFLMAGFAYYETSSPIHRGVFLARSMLGRTLRPPPEAVSPLPPELHADLSTRERVILQTKPASCQTCHAMINPLGFSLERFDAVGRYREEENGKPVDTSGVYLTRDGEKVQFRGIRELAEYLANSEETHQAFVEQLFHHMIKQSIGAHSPTLRTELAGKLQQLDFNIRKLLVEIVVAAAIHQRDA